MVAAQMPGMGDATGLGNYAHFAHHVLGVVLDTDGLVARVKPAL